MNLHGIPSWQRVASTRVLAGVFGLILVTNAAAALAQAPPAAAPPVASAPAAEGREGEAPDSPRASLSEYLALASRGEFTAAAGFLELEPQQVPNGAELARKLKAVLDRHLWVELETISPLSEGDTNDGQPREVDQVGSVPSDGHKEPVRIVKRETPEGARWLFSKNTVARVDRWYSELDDRWIRSYLPRALLRFGPKQLLLWQWLVLPLLLAAAWYAGRTLSWLTRRLLTTVTARTAGQWDDALVAGLRVPLALAWAVGVALLLERFLALNPAGEAFVEALLAAVASVALFAGLFSFVDVAGALMKKAPWCAGRPSAESALGLAVRAGKVLVVALGAVAALIQLGYPVASVLAGLGIGGIGLALAAQKTVENLFGSVSLAVDEAVRVGDFMKIDEHTMGSIEAIGLRSTRIRTLDRTLVSVPNGALAGMRIESYTARDRVRLNCAIGLEYGTSSAQIRDVIARIETLLRAHPKIWPDDMTVSFKQFGAYSLDLEVMAWFNVSWGEYKNAMRSELLLQLMEAVEQAGCAFAFPTQTLHVQRQPDEPA